MKQVWLEINLSALRYNLCQIKKKLNFNFGKNPKTKKFLQKLPCCKSNLPIANASLMKEISNEVKVLAVVKDNAYGHSLAEVSQVLAKEKVDYFGISNVDEARKLRKIGIKVPILNLGVISSKEEISEIIEYDLSQTVCSRKIAFLLNKEAGANNKRIKIHLKIDTGMGRLGVFLKEGIELAEYISRLKNLQLEGIFTHFPTGEDKKFTFSQIKEFRNFSQKLNRKGIGFTYQHSANSLAFLNFSESWFNLIRPGIILYGIYPQFSLNKKIELKPVLSCKTKVVYIKDIPKGWSIGYERSYTTKKKQRIAILPVGYANGYPYNLSNNGNVLIAGMSFPVIGRVSMDQTIVRVNKEVKIGDEVVLIGKQKDKQIKVEELAKLSGTIPYEIVCRLGHLPHKFIDKDGD